MVLSRSSSTTYLRLCILSAFGAFAMSANAATDVNVISDSELPQVELDKIVVTATRTPTKTSNVIAQTRVVDKEDLKRFQGQNALISSNVSQVSVIIPMAGLVPPQTFICVDMIISKYWCLLMGYAIAQLVLAAQH